MATWFNTFSVDSNGNLLQIDELIAMHSGERPVPPVPPRPVTDLPDNAIQFRFSNASYVPSSLSGSWYRIEETTENVWNCELHNASESELFAGAFADRSETEVDILGTGKMTGITDVSSMFKGCTALTGVGIMEFPDATDMSGMFDGCTALSETGTMYMDRVQDASGMFRGCTSLTSARISGTPVCTDMSHMFSGCENLTSVTIEDTARVTNMAYMFAYCHSLEELPMMDTGKVITMECFCGDDRDTGSSPMALRTIPAYDTHSCMNFASAFEHCAEIVTVPKMNTSSATTMRLMFAYCEKLEYVPDLSTPNVTRMDHMFRNCYSLPSLPAMDTSKVSNFSHFAHRCYSLESFPAYDTSSATVLSRIASCCPKLTSFPVINTSKATTIDGMLCGHGANYDTEHPMHIATLPAFDFSNVENAENAFGNNVALLHVPEYHMPKVTDVSNMYLDCINVESGIYEAYAQFRDMATPPASVANFAKNCGTNSETGSIETSVIPSTWGGTGVSLPAYTLRFSFSNTDYNPSTVVSKGSWSKVETEEGNIWDWTYENSSWYDVFYGKFTNANNRVDILGSGDLSGVTTMQYMFATSSALRNVTLMQCAPNMSYCFQAGSSGSKLEQCIIAGMERTTNLESTLSGNSSMTNCRLIGHIGVGSNTVNMTSILAMCTSMEEITPFDTSHASDLHDAFSRCTSLKHVPYIDLSSAIRVDNMFLSTVNVESGSYALYQQMASMQTVPGRHENCFSSCGSNTENGRIELELIPDGWK